MSIQRRGRTVVDRAVFRRIKLDPDAQLGVASQIRAQLMLLIADGKLVAGDRLPAVRASAEHLGVNLNTVRAAYRKLEEDGVVRTRHGVGTEVLPVDVTTFVGGAAGVSSNTIGVVIAGLDPFYLDLLRGLEAGAARSGALPLIVNAQDSPERAHTAIAQLAARGVDGIIAVSVGGPPEQDRDHDGLPIVYVDQPDRRGVVLLFNGRAGGAEMTQHLVDHGHERLGFVSPPIEWPNLAEVHAGYAQTLADSGLEVDDQPLIEVDEFSVAAGRDGAGRLLDLDHPPTAILASGGLVALGVLQEAQDRGIGVPDELAIAGYGELDAAAFTSPQLTMVSLPTYEIGLRAMEVLSQVLTGSDPDPARIVLDVELQIRQSCGSHD